MNHYAHYISNYLYRRGIIKEEDRPIYTYGAEIALDFLIILSIICFFGIITDQIVSTIIFLVIYCMLRGCGGGYHARTYAKCCLCSVSTYLVVIFLNMAIGSDASGILFLPILFIGDIILFITAPSKNLINPKSQKDILKNRNKLLKRMVIINILTFVCWLVPFVINIPFVISCTLMAVAILSFINGLQNYFIERRSLKWNGY